MINRTIKLLMISDMFIATGFGLTDPIVAIYIKENLIGGTIFAAGLSSTLFLVTKCAVQLPFSHYVDGHDDKIRWLIVGTFLISIIPFIYIFANDIKYIYLAQILHGIGSGLAFPTWLGLWSTHLDKKHESFEWSPYSTFTGLGIAASAAVGATIAQIFGFVYTFIIVGILSLIGCFILFALEKAHNDKHANAVHSTHYHYKRKMHTSAHYH